MSAIYLESDKVKVFPAAGRSDSYPEGFLITEDNLSKAIRFLHPQNNASFIIGNEFKAPLKIVLNGYLFEITDISSIPTPNAYAAIYIVENPVAGSYTRLISPSWTTERTLDPEDGKFHGLCFAATEDGLEEAPAGSTRIVLHILENNKIPLKNQLKTIKVSLNADTTHIGQNFLEIGSDF